MSETPEHQLTVEEARALVDAGYMPLAEYLRTYKVPKLYVVEADDGQS